jgi:hypothetical protein
LKHQHFKELPSWVQEVFEEHQMDSFPQGGELLLTEVQPATDQTIQMTYPQAWARHCQPRERIPTAVSPGALKQIPANEEVLIADIPQGKSFMTCPNPNYPQPDLTLPRALGKRYPCCFRKQGYYQRRNKADFFDNLNQLQNHNPYITPAGIYLYLPDNFNGDYVATFNYQSYPELGIIIADP